MGDQATDIQALVTLVRTTLDGYGIQLEELRKGQQATQEGVQQLRLDVVRLQERSYEREMGELRDTLKERETEIKALAGEVEALKRDAAKTEGMTMAAKAGWGLVVSSPGILAIIYQVVTGMASGD